MQDDNFLYGIVISNKKVLKKYNKFNFERVMLWKKLTNKLFEIIFKSATVGFMFPNL